MTIKLTSEILLFLNLLCLLAGYITFFQTEYQLVSDLIPKSVIIDISKPYFKASLIASVIFATSLFFYMRKKYTAAMILSAVMVMSYYLVMMAFALNP